MKSNNQVHTVWVCQLDIVITILMQYPPPWIQNIFFQRYLPQLRKKFLYICFLPLKSLSPLHKIPLPLLPTPPPNYIHFSSLWQEFRNNLGYFCARHSYPTQNASMEWKVRRGDNFLFWRYFCNIRCDFNAECMGYIYEMIIFL